VRGDHQESALASRPCCGCDDDHHHNDDASDDDHHHNDDAYDDDHHHNDDAYDDDVDIIIDNINEYHRRQTAHGCSSCSSKDHHVCRANAIAESARSNYRISLRSECQ